MSVKSTQFLTRTEAEEKYVALILESKELKRKLRSEAVLLDNHELENILNDSYHGGEGFENYIIKEPVW
jgi:hypothetical protein